MINQDHNKFQVKTIFPETSGRPKGRPLMTSWYYKGGRGTGRSKIKERLTTHSSKKWQHGKKRVKRQEKQ